MCSDSFKEGQQVTIYLRLQPYHADVDAFIDFIISRSIAMTLKLYKCSRNEDMHK